MGCFLTTKQEGIHRFQIADPMESLNDRTRARLLFRLEKCQSLVHGRFLPGKRNVVDTIWSIVNAGTSKEWPHWDVNDTSALAAALAKVQEFFELLGGRLPGRKVLHFVRSPVSLAAANRNSLTGVPALAHQGGRILTMAMCDWELLMTIHGVEPTGQVINSIFRTGNNAQQTTAERYSFAIVTKEEWDEAYSSYARDEFKALPSAEKRLRFI